MVVVDTLRGVGKCTVVTAMTQGSKVVLLRCGPISLIIREPYWWDWGRGHWGGSDQKVTPCFHSTIGITRGRPVKIYIYGFWGSISAGKGRTNTHTHIFTTKLGPSVCFAAGKDYKHLTCKANGYCQFAHTDGLANFKVVKIAFVFQMATDLPIMYRNKAKMTNCNFEGLPRPISKSCSYEKCLEIKFWKIESGIGILNFGPPEPSRLQAPRMYHRAREGPETKICFPIPLETNNFCYWQILICSLLPKFI